MTNTMSYKEAAEYIGCPERTLRNAKNNGEIAYVKLGNRITFLAADCDAYILDQRHAAWAEPDEK